MLVWFLKYGYYKKRIKHWTLHSSKSKKSNKHNSTNHWSPFVHSLFRTLLTNTQSQLSSHIFAHLHLSSPFIIFFSQSCRPLIIYPQSSPLLSPCFISTYTYHFLLTALYVPSPQSPPLSSLPITTCLLRVTSIDRFCIARCINCTVKKFTENFHKFSGTLVPRTKFDSWKIYESFEL